MVLFKFSHLSHFASGMAAPSKHCPAKKEILVDDVKHLLQIVDSECPVPMSLFVGEWIE